MNRYAAASVKSRPLQKRWACAPAPFAEDVERLSGEINVNPYLSAILVQRGIAGYESAKRFFRPSMSDLHDPFLMKDMDKAVARLAQAIEHGERILIYGDYDVDGVTSVALVYRYLQRFYSRCGFYVPDRFKEGYGISEAGVLWAAENDFSLIVALDLGIQAMDAVLLGQKRGIDFIICDHHRPGDRIPAAVAVLNPKQPDCAYPFDELSGCGIGFKLIQAFSLQHPAHAHFADDIDLVAASIAADIVPICGENRTLAYHGLEKLNKQPSPGLAALMRVAHVAHRPLQVSDIVFKLAPRLNAAGRVTHASKAVELLLAPSLAAAAPLANPLGDDNTLRKTRDTEATIQALAMIEGSPNSRSVVVYNPVWSKGIVGIVAARCVDAYYKPTLALTRSGDWIVGSGRSVEGFDLYRAVASCGDLLEKFGGHKYAIGLTLKPDNLPALRERLEAYTVAAFTEDMTSPRLEIDATLPLHAINARFAAVLRQMAPFGPANPRPLFAARGVVAAEPPVIYKDRHIRLSVRQPGDPFAISIVGFDLADYAERIMSGGAFDIAFHVEESAFLGASSVELRIKDIKFDSTC